MGEYRKWRNLTEIMVFRPSTQLAQSQSFAVVQSMRMYVHWYWYWSIVLHNIGREKLWAQHMGHEHIVWRMRVRRPSPRNRLRQTEA